MTFEEAYQQIRKHHYEILNERESVSKRARLSLSTWVLDILTECLDEDEQTEPIVRCKDCDNYAGDGMYCAWNVLTGDMGYCHHARPKGSTDITAEQTEPICSKMEQVEDEPQTDCPQSNICAKPCKECGACEEECGMWKALNKLQTERIKTPDYCDICNHKGCRNCIANNLDDYCVPSGYEPITQTETQNSNLTFEKPQTEMPRCSVNGTPFDECGFCEYFNCETCKCEADVTQTEREGE